MKRTNDKSKISLVIVAILICLAILFSIWDYADTFFYYFRWIALLSVIIWAITYFLIRNHEDISELLEDIFKDALILIFIIAIIAFLKRLI
jgi:hypothetical protein